MATGGRGGTAQRDLVRLRRGVSGQRRLSGYTFNLGDTNGIGHVS